MMFLSSVASLFAVFCVSNVRAETCDEDHELNRKLNLLQISMSFHAYDSSAVQTIGEAEGAPDEMAQINGTSSPLVKDALMPTPQLSPDQELPDPDGWYFLENQPFVTNPSLIIRGDEAWMFLRRLRHLGCDDSKKIGGWLNDMVFVSMSLEDLRHPATSGEYSHGQYSQYVVAPDARFQDANDTLVECSHNSRKDASKCSEITTGFQLTFGPEDPRMFVFDGKTYMYMVATDVISNSANAEIDLLSGRPNCSDISPYGQFLHMAEIIQTHPSIVYGPTVRLIKDPMEHVEKAWSMFEYKPPQGNPQLLAVYSVSPHTILLIDPATGNTTTMHAEASQHLAHLANSRHVDETEFHGGSGVVFIQNTEQPYYLSCLHYSQYDTNFSRHYFTIAYKFRAEPPFDVLSIATTPLPLVLINERDTLGLAYVAGVAYVASMAYDNGDVVIGYGSGDTFPRIFRQPISDFEQTYFP